MKIINLAVLSIAMMVMLSSCIPAPLIIGGASGGAVYSTTSDHIKDQFNISREQAFETMIGILTANDAAISVSSIADGKIQAKKGQSIIFVNMKDLDERTIEVSIRAKKHIELIPDKETAVWLYKQFIKEVM